ncbi:unnamed protein product [Amoebophrya sp. A25]|nr:unnamed protein product [Amoebophrya sp. A25]|eukprot:GSA25T00001158001.1
MYTGEVGPWCAANEMEAAGTASLFLDHTAAAEVRISLIEGTYVCIRVTPLDLDGDTIGTGSASMHLAAATSSSAAMLPASSKLRHMPVFFHYCRYDSIFFASDEEALATQVGPEQRGGSASHREAVLEQEKQDLLRQLKTQTNWPHTRGGKVVANDGGMEIEEQRIWQQRGVAIAKLVDFDLANPDRPHVQLSRQNLALQPEDHEHQVYATTSCSSPGDPHQETAHDQQKLGLPSIFAPGFAYKTSRQCPCDLARELHRESVCVARHLRKERMSSTCVGRQQSYTFFYRSREDMLLARKSAGSWTGRAIQQQRRGGSAFLNEHGKVVGALAASTSAIASGLGPAGAASKTSMLLYPRTQKNATMATSSGPLHGSLYNGKNAHPHLVLDHRRSSSGAAEGVAGILSHTLDLRYLEISIHESSLFRAPRRILYHLRAHDPAKRRTKYCSLTQRELFIAFGETHLSCGLLQLLRNARCSASASDAMHARITNLAHLIFNNEHLQQEDEIKTSKQGVHPLQNQAEHEPNLQEVQELQEPLGINKAHSSNHEDSDSDNVGSQKAAAQVLLPPPLPIRLRELNKERRQATCLQVSLVGGRVHDIEIVARTMSSSGSLIEK